MGGLLTHSPRFAVVRIKDMVSGSPVFMVVMVSMMRMFMCHGVCVSFVYKHMCMLIQVLAIFIGCHLAKYVRELSYYGSQLHCYRSRITSSNGFLCLT